MEHRTVEHQNISARPARKRRRTRAHAGGDAVPPFAQPAVGPPTAVTEQPILEPALPIHAAPPEPQPPNSDASPAEGLAQELAKETVLPQHLSHLSQTYCFATMSIISSSKIEHKARILLRHMARFSFLDRNPKPGVVILHARKDVVNKMISVVEIAKRDIEGEKGKWWQYSRISGELVEMKEKKKMQKEVKEDVKAATRRKWGQGENPAADGEEGKAREAEDQEMADSTDDASAFETMPDKTTADARPKMRMMPTMTIYMSRVTIPEFKGEFGYVEALGR